MLGISWLLNKFTGYFVIVTVYSTSFGTIFVGGEQVIGNMMSTMYVTQYKIHSYRNITLVIPSKIIYKNYLIGCIDRSLYMAEYEL